MNTGKTIFSQLMDFLPTYEFRQCVNRYQGHYKVKTLSCWDQFTQEWFVRMNDLGCKPQKWFEEYNDLSTDKILEVANKYGAKFVVTEKPKVFKLNKLYENEQFVLYEAKPRQSDP